MKKVLAIILLLSSALLVKAQDKKAPVQPDSLIKISPIEGSRHNEYGYAINGKVQSREAVMIRLMAYAPSAMELNKAKINHTWIYVTAGGVVLSTIGAAIEFTNNSKYATETMGTVNGTPSPIYQKHSLNGAYVFTGIATGFLIANIINFTKVAKHNRKAFKVYNQQFE
jgi:hypothetical protein